MTTERHDYDQAIKEVFLSGRYGLLQLLGLLNVIWKAELESELVAPRRHADLVWLIVENGVKVIIHIEIQIAPDPDMDKRMAEYGLRIYFREGIVVRSYVIYLKPTESIPTSPYAPLLPDGTPAFLYPFTAIKLWELAPEDVLQSPSPDLWPLAVLMQETNYDLVVQVARQIAAASIPLDQQAKLEGLLILFAGLRLPVAPLAKLIQEDKMLKEIFQHSSLRELIIQEVGEEKLAEGIQQGIQQGLEEGRLETLREMVVLFARQQFGALSDAARERIEATTDPSRLQAAALAMTTFADETALLTFLDAPPAQET